MSATATAYVWQHSPYTGTAFTIHLAIADVANDMHGNRVWASAATIAAKARSTRETVSRTVKQMVADGFLAYADEGQLDQRKSRHQGREFTFLMPQTDVTSDHIELGKAEADRCDEGSHRDVTSDHIHDVTSDHIQGTQDPTEEAASTGNPPTPLPSDDGGSRGLALVPSAPASPSRSRKLPRTLKAACEEVLAAWVEATGRSAARARMNDARRKKVKARLAEGYTAEELVSAVRGIAMSPFHMGDNPGGKRYDDITVALRDGAQVEKFRDLYESGGRTEGKRLSGAQQALAAMKAQGLA